ncbi:hypothetical protein GMLC_34610 [Geomonas limicola]|uniref:Uncharacterized protein n=1 Tax=Geomonas limicola TaxID=2740186 RepID=A0A6V8NB76_9BACT|nr:hypothetical protein [Geomonas limicola]GFO69882.1 hypothetical protein GMLC_34610 [Geomonas limicola]
MATRKKSSVSLDDIFDTFHNNTNGGRNAGIALLREMLFYQNTGKWPSHLKGRKWRQFDGGKEWQKRKVT